MAELKLRWPNVERALVAYFKAELSDPTYTNPGGTMPGRYITVERSGGSSQWIDKAVDVSVAVHAATRGEMWDLAADVESAMWSLGAHAAGGIYIDSVEERFGFAFDPPADQNVRRASATFTLTVRPYRA